jgi:hypothetical protein
MKEITYKILECMNTLPQIPLSRFSKQSQNFLSKLFNIFIEGQHRFVLENIRASNAINNEQSVDEYIPIEIQNVINGNRKTCTEFNFNVHDRKITLCMYHFENIKSSLLKDHLKRVYIWLYVATQFAPSKCSRNLKVNIYFTKSKKGLPGRLSPLRPIHANSAFTTSCNVETEINIFREEEWFKVLIHETFHCLGLDFSDMPRHNYDERVLKMFPIKSDVRLFETYCETWAETLNIMFISFLSTRKENISKMIEKTEKMLYYERMFSIIQCTKVLKHFHLTYRELYKKDSVSHSKRSLHYKEETQILSYYILKCIYMFHINDFIEWCVSRNGETLNFNKTPGNIHKYVDLLEALHIQPEFLSAVENFEAVSYSKYKVLNNTLRMSVFELT